MRDPFNTRNPAERKSDPAKDEKNAGEHSRLLSVKDKSAKNDHTQWESRPCPIENEVHLQWKILMCFHTDLVTQLEDLAEQSFKAEGNSTEASVSGIQQPNTCVPGILVFEKTKNSRQSRSPKYHRKNNYGCGVDGIATIGVPKEGRSYHQKLAGDETAGLKRCEVQGGGSHVHSF